VTRYPYIPLEEAEPLPLDQKVIFLWMPKCAGVTTHYALKAALQKKYCDYNNQYRNLHFNPSIRCTTVYHSHVPSLVETGFLPEAWVASAFKFAFVRNPWERLVSLYHYLINMRYGPLPQPFEEFIVHVTLKELPKPGPNNLLGFYQANSLLDWIRPNGVWQPQFIGRFENLQLDWDIICILLGLPKIRLTVQNSSKHEHYSRYYGDYTRSLVAARYADEIEMFGYNFGDK
jgi:chondroitin 4-sulfotransferase 11